MRVLRARSKGRTHGRVIGGLRLWGKAEQNAPLT